MNKILSIACAFFSTTFLLAQNYSPIKNKDVAYFTNNQKTVLYPIKIDSVKKVDGDSVHFLYKQIRYGNNSCQYTSLGDSWLGEKVLMKPNGLVTFLNRDKKPILLKSQAKLNEKWVAYQSAKWYAEIVVSSISSETFLGITDSVKTFSINIFKSNGVDTIHPYDGYQLKVSKTHGLIKAVNFYLWDSGSDYNEAALYNLNLAGFENARIGQSNLTGKQIYNYEVGDEFHVEDYNSQGDPPYIVVVKSLKFRYKVLTKINSVKDYTYTLRRESEDKSGSKTIYKVDTVSEKYNFDQLTELKDQLTPEKSVLVLGKFSTTNRFSKTRPEFSLSGKPDCLNEMIATQCLYKPMSYIDGLGGPYYDCSRKIWNGDRRSLIYYKKRAEEWGVPIILNTDELVFDSGISIFPNPARENLKVVIPTNLNNVTFILTDLSGVKVVSSKTQTGINTINVNSLNIGLYFYQIVGAEKVIKSGKIIIE